ncbi:MAG TPA: hypothetical protein VLH79_03720 [Chthonomonadales bacterium]|nr:hypothetical protein [Chthonomonadales bacterium]
MRVAVVIGASLAAVAGLAALLVPRAPDVHDYTVGDFSRWRPRAEDIAADLRGQPGLSEAQRMERFAVLFTRRFRDKHLAVKVEVTRPDRLNVLCAASIPRWDSARIAGAATAEAGRLFGRQFGADIFESYVTQPRVKVAELTPGTPRARIEFSPAFETLRARERRDRRPASTVSPSPTRSPRDSAPSRPPLTPP